MQKLLFITITLSISISCNISVLAMEEDGGTVSSSGEIFENGDYPLSPISLGNSQEIKYDSKAYDEAVEQGVAAKLEERKLSFELDVFAAYERGLRDGSLNCKYPDKNSTLASGKKKYKIVLENPKLYYYLAQFFLERGFAPGGAYHTRYGNNANYYFNYFQEQITNKKIQVKIVSKYPQEEDIGLYLPLTYFKDYNLKKREFKPRFCIDITRLQELIDKENPKLIDKENPKKSWYQLPSVHLGLTAVTCLSAGWLAQTWWQSKE